MGSITKYELNVFNVLDFKNSTSNFYLEFDLVEELHLFSDMLK